MKINVFFSVVLQLLSVASFAQNLVVTKYPSVTPQSFTVNAPDILVSSHSATTNGSMLVIRSTPRSSQSALRNRTYLRFEIDSLTIPSNAVITSAKLCLYPTSSDYVTSDAAIGTTSKFIIGYLYQELSSSSIPNWSETAPLLNFLTQPEKIWSDNLPSSFVNQVGNELAHREFDVKACLQAIISKTVPNYGFQIRAVSEDAVLAISNPSGPLVYHSRESTSPGTKPKLVVSYYVPFSVTNALITHASSTTSTDGSIIPTVTGGPSAATYNWYNSSGTLLQSSPSPTLNKLAPGWYGLEIVGSIPATPPATGTVKVPSVYMAFLIGAYCESSTITFAPGPKYIDDATVNSNNPHTFIGNDVPYFFKASLTETYQENSVMRFRLWVDNQVTINTANLTLGAYGSSGNSINTVFPTNQSSFARLKGDWSENFASWNRINTIPTDPVPATTIIPNATLPSEPQTVNMKSFWDSWKVDNTKNYGVLFKIDPGTGTKPLTYNLTRMFSSSDLPVNERRPSLSFSIRLTNNCKEKVSYAKLEKVLKGVNYRVQSRLLFFYDEEYTNTTHTTLNYKIYDESNQSMSALTSGQQKPLSHGDNRYVIDISTLTLNKSYILEVTNDKSEKFYLRFTKEN